MKLNEITRTPEQLYAMALKVGEREFGASHTKFVHEPKLKKVIKRRVSGELDTYGWVFYPSNLSKFHDYSDQEFKDVEPDKDGLVYAADAEGNLYILSGGKAKGASTNFKAMFKGFKFEGWQVEHIEESAEPIEYMGDAVAVLYFKNSRLATYGDAGIDVYVKKDGTWKARAYRQESGGVNERMTDGGKANGTDLTTASLEAFMKSANKVFREAQ